MDGDLRAWEERALKEAMEQRFTAYVELQFAYLVLDHPRCRLFQRAFHGLIQDDEFAKAFMRFCKKKAMGGIQT